MARRSLAWLAGLTLAGALTPAPALGADRIFWANGIGQLGSADLNAADSSGAVQLDTGAATLSFPSGVALDPRAGRVWWVNDAGPDSVWSAKLNGSEDVVGPLSLGTATVTNPQGVAIDPTVPGGRIYWANLNVNGPSSIAFANLNGTGGGTLQVDPSFVDHPDAVAVDPVGGRVYWANSDTIAFANLADGSGAGLVHTGPATTSGIDGIAVDVTAGRIYWTNGGNDSVSFADLANTGAASDVGGDLDTTGAPLEGPRGIAVDPVAGRVYWGNAHAISYANLNDTGHGGQVMTGTLASSVSHALALLVAPRSTAAPVVSGGTPLGSSLSCSQGSWAPDFVAASIFEAPQSFSYQWSRDGTDIPGATQPAVTAGAAGSYSCRVTAHGYDGTGDTMATSGPHAVTPPPPTTTGIGTPAAFGAATRVSLTLAARRISSRGPVKVRIANANGFAVSATLSTQTTRPVMAAHRRRVKLSTHRLTLKAHSALAVELALPSTLRRLLAGQRKLSLSFALTVGDPAGHHRTVTATLTPRLLVAKRAR
jgi:hypothetical protein